MGGRLLISSQPAHVDESLWLTNQKHGVAARSYLLHSSPAGVNLGLCELPASAKTVQKCWVKTIVLSQSSTLCPYSISTNNPHFEPLLVFTTTNIYTLNCLHHTTLTNLSTKECKSFVWFVCHIEISQIIMFVFLLHSWVLLLLESSQWVGVHWVGFIMFLPTMNKLLIIEQNFYWKSIWIQN
jgi:hypothetical protein